MPHRHNLQPLTAYAVVDPIADAIDVEAPYVGCACFRDFRADTRLLDKKGEDRLKVLTDGSRCGRAIRGPPLSNAVDLSCRPARDEELEGHELSVAAQLLEEFFA